MRYYFTHTRLTAITKTKTVNNKDVENWKPHKLLREV